jgi:hypothetical protein
MSPSSSDTSANPVPTDDEMAAIVAAIEVAWPRPAAAAPETDAPRWRFSGRWWAQPVASRRSRPWMGGR